jgi:hypothetical protein
VRLTRACSGSGIIAFQVSPMEAPPGWPLYQIIWLSVAGQRAPAKAIGLRNKQLGNCQSGVNGKRRQ